MSVRDGDNSGVTVQHLHEVMFAYPKEQLCQDASYCPHVNTHTVHPGTKQELRGAIPPGKRARKGLKFTILKQQVGMCGTTVFLQ